LSCGSETSASGRLDPFAAAFGYDRYLRIAAVHRARLRAARAHQRKHAIEFFDHRALDLRQKTKMLEDRIRSSLAGIVLSTYPK
jgi:hypothetical protein